MWSSNLPKIKQEEVTLGFRPKQLESKVCNPNDFILPLNIYADLEQ